jgi:hypothetical protein
MRATESSRGLKVIKAWEGVSAPAIRTDGTHTTPVGVKFLLKNASQQRRLSYETVL